MVTLDREESRIAFLGTYPPRQCGIATFTADLWKAVEDVTGSCQVVAVNDQAEGYDYRLPVRFTILESDLSGYRRAAEYLNTNHVDMVSLQHEYGIFGGEAGSHVLALLQSLKMPVVGTFHTILHDPKEEHFLALQKVAALCDRVVVMSRRGKQFLQSIYGVGEDKIDVIPHGIPDVPFVDPNLHKEQFDVAGRLVLLTFGLLSPSKGLESVIRALPRIRQAHPNVVYLIVGATHPYWVRTEGESHRLSLQRLVRELNVEDHVIFHNRYVSARQLSEFISATDVYLTPYLNEDQITSGTLAWAVGAGKAVISTPYWYAQELLAQERGVLVPFNDHQSVADAVIDLLANHTQLELMRKRAYLLGRQMIWSHVAQQYLDTFAKARVQRASKPRPAIVSKNEARKRGELPGIRLAHLQRMTDDTGLLQHAFYAVPRYEHGYTTDDNARALILVTKLAQLGELPIEKTEDLATRYLAFLSYAFNTDSLRFRNFLEYDRRRWAEEKGSEDSHGRALWALGSLVNGTPFPEIKAMAEELFDHALGASRKLNSARACAYTLLGIDEYLKWFSGHAQAHELRSRLSAQLMDLYRHTGDDTWRWFEDRLTYANARLSQALIVTGEATGDRDMLTVGLSSLDWLCEIQRSPTGCFLPIGSNGFYVRGQERARFDQQPIEACATVAACLTAYQVTHDKRWYTQAEQTFEWFLGRNDLQTPLYDARTGGCHDALHPERVNGNQGAESTLSYLLSLADMRLVDRAIVLVEKKKRIDGGRGEERIGRLAQQPA